MFFKPRAPPYASIDTFLTIFNPIRTIARNEFSPFAPFTEQWQEGEADGEGQGEGDQDGRAGGGSLRLHLQLNGADDHWSLRARCTDDPGAFGCRDINMSSPLCCLPGADCTMAAKCYSNVNTIELHDTSTRDLCTASTYH